VANESTLFTIKITFLWSTSIIHITTKYLLWNSPINSYDSFCKLWSIQLLNGLKKMKLIRRLFLNTNKYIK